MKLHWRPAGSCRALEALTIRGGRWRVETYPSKFGLFRHPREGWTLFDTGYAPRFLEATARLPYALYRWVTPVSIDASRSAVAQTAALGVRPEEVKTVILSHLHADHVAGLRDFPRATIVTSREGYDALSPLTGISAVRQGFLPHLLPADFERRVRWVDGHTDLWDDGVVLLKPLSGHAVGQHGALIETALGPVFLCADAVWQSRAYRENVDLPAITHALLSSNPDLFRESLSDLCDFHRANPNVPILPSHCSEVVL